MIIKTSELQVGMTVVTRNSNGTVTSRDHLVKWFDTGSKFPELAFTTEHGIVKWHPCGKVEIQ